jgi:hypothetical protein
VNQDGRRHNVCSTRRPGANSGRIPRSGRQVMEPNQVHLVAPPVLRDPQQIRHAVESRLARKIVCHILERNQLDSNRRRRDRQPSGNGHRPSPAGASRCGWCIGFCRAGFPPEGVW